MVGVVENAVLSSPTRHIQRIAAAIILHLLNISMTAAAEEQRSRIKPQATLLLLLLLSERARVRGENDT